MCLHDIVSPFALLGAAVITSFLRNRKNISSLYLREQWHSQWPGSLKTHTHRRTGREGGRDRSREGRKEDIIIAFVVWTLLPQTES